MSDVFVSYSRKDIAFARILHDALKARDMDMWIDWQDIPPSADWLAEVYQAIEAADTFVFIVSKTSAESEVCHEEIAHAAKHNKRLVPIVVEEVDAEALPPAVAALNWIFFREEDDFQESFDKLLEAVQTDLEWVRAHTRLLVRAIEWDGKRRDSSFLLRGRDQREAEDWLAQGTEKEPRPTPLQTEYIFAGRRAAASRQRVTLGAVTFGLIVAVVLALLAWGQRNAALDAQTTAVAEAQVRATAQAQAEAAEGTAVAETHVRATAEADAITQRIVAEQRAQEYRRAYSGQLAVLAREVMEQSPQLSLLLVAEAVKVTSVVGESQVQIAEEVLREVLASTGGIPLAGSEFSIDAMALSPDGHWLVTGGREGVIQLWDMTESMAAPMEIYNKQEQPVPFWGPVRSIPKLMFSPDRKLVKIDCISEDLLGSCVTTELQLWMADNLTTEPVTLGTQNGFVIVAEFSPDGQWLVTGGCEGEDVLGDCQAGESWLWNLSDPLSKPIELIGHRNRVVASAFSPDGGSLATASRSSILFWRMDNLSDGPVSLAGDNGTINALAFSTQGHWLAVGEQEGTIRLWDAKNMGAEPTVLMTHGGSIESLAFSPDGLWLATGSSDGITRIWNPGQLSEEPITLPRSNGSVNLELFSRDGRWFAAGSEDGVVLVWDTQDFSEHFSELLTNPHTKPSFTAEPATLHGHEGLITAIAFFSDCSPPALVSTQERSPQGNTRGCWLVTAGADGTARIWDTARPMAAPVVLNHDYGPGKHWSGRISSFAFSPNGTQIATVGGDGTLRLWDLSEPNEIPDELSPLAPYGYILVAAFSPDGHWLVATGRGIIDIWDLEHIAAQPIEHHTFTNLTSPRRLTISHDGRWLAIEEGDKAELWDMDMLRKDTHTEPLLLIANTSSRDDGVLFSPDSQWLATLICDETSSSSGCPNARVQLYSTNDLSAKPLELPHDSWVSAAAFSPDSRLLATGDGLGTIQLYDVSNPASDLTRPWQYEDGPDVSVGDLEFSPDGSWLAAVVGHGEVKLWSMDNLSAEAVVLGRGRGGSFGDVSFSPNGRWLAVGGTLWNMNDPIVPVELHGHDGAVQSVSFNPDGHWLATLDEHEVRLWSMNIDELLALACSTTGRNCTQTEWAGYFPGEPYRKTCPQWPDTLPKPPTPTPTPTLIPTPTPTPRFFFTPTPRPELKTPAGNVVITEVEVANEGPLGLRPESGHQFLFVWFESSSGNAMDTSYFFETWYTIYVLGDDGSRSECNLIGETDIDGQLFIGFPVPTTASEFTLYFYDNPPIELAVSP